jgi:hypothetical protein
MHVMEPDIAGNPLEDYREAQICRTLQSRGGWIPRIVTGPTNWIAAVLHREQPDADDRGEDQDRQLDGGHALAASNSEPRCCQSNANQSPNFRMTRASRRQLTPFGQSRRSVLFEDIASVEVGVVIEVVVSRRVDGGEFLQRFAIFEPRYRVFSLPEWLVWVLGPIIEPSPTFLAVRNTYDLHRSAIGAKPVRHDGPWPTIALHRMLDKFHCSPAIPPFRRENLEHLTLVIDSSPQVMRLAIDPHEHFVRVPLPLRIAPVLDTTLANLGSKHWTESIRPEPYRLMADVDAALEHQILDMAQRQRITDVHHRREADDLGRTVEMAERIFHPPKLQTNLTQFKANCSDNVHHVIDFDQIFLK